MLGLSCLDIPNTAYLASFLIVGLLWLYFISVIISTAVKILRSIVSDKRQSLPQGFCPCIKNAHQLLILSFQRDLRKWSLIPFLITRGWTGARRWRAGAKSNCIYHPSWRSCLLLCNLSAPFPSEEHAREGEFCGLPM